MKTRNIVLFLAGMFFALPLMAADLQIVKNGKSNYTVIIADPDNEMSKVAANELITYLEKSTGCKLSRNQAGKSRIVIGMDQKLQKKLGKDLPVKNELRIQTIGGDLYLYGGGKFGTMYAVSTFLEKFAGVRWFSPYPGGTYIPAKKDITVTDTNIRQKPGLAIRTMANWMIRVPREQKELFYLHNKINNNANSARYSDIVTQYAQCHTLFSYIRPHNSNTHIWVLKWGSKEEQDRAYFKSNPDYFSMNAAGKRVPNMQLCFSNPALRKEFLRRLELQFKSRGAGSYSISAMDWPGKFCYCPGCQALEKKYQCDGGPLYDFLLEASKTAAKYPGVYISTLAYRKKQSEFPPVMEGKLPDNLIIIFAPIDDDVTKPFNHKNNLETYENLKKWAKLSKNVWLWYYVYHDEMEGITERLAKDVKLIHQAGATGSFFEYKMKYMLSGIATDEMTAYVAMKLYWNPMDDWKKHREDYCRYFYGKAADSILAWMDMRDAYTRNIPVHNFWSSNSMEWGYYKDPANILKEVKLVESWLKMTENQPFAHQHVKRLRIAVDVVLLKNYPKVLKIAPEYKGKSMEIYNRLVKDCQELEKIRNTQYITRYFVNPLKQSLKIAEIEPKPLPKGLVPAGKQVARFFPYKGGKVVEKAMPDSAWGYAYGREIKDENAKAAMTFGYYDILKRVQKNNSVPYDKIKKDSKFHIYKVTKTTLSASCRVWVHPTWGLGYDNVGELFNVDFPDRKWDIYVSLKFTGPAYQQKPETEKNFVWIDQVILVRE